MRLWPARSSLGLEISDHALKIVKIAKGSKGSVKINTHSIEKLPKLAIVEGKIVQPDVVVDLLRKAVKRARARKKRVHLIVPSTVIMVRFLKMPDLPLKKLRKVIDFELGNNVRLPFDDPHYDFVKMQRQEESETAGNEPPQCDIVLAAASKSVIDQYLHLALNAGLKPESIDIKAFALFRIVQYMGVKFDNSTCMAVDINDSATELSIYRNGQLSMTRNVPLDVHGGERAAGIHPGVFAELGQLDPLQEICDNLAQEIERLINFYRYSLHHRDEAIDGIYISGELEHPNDVIENLKARLSFPIQLIGSESEESSRRGDFKLNPRMSVPFGAALRGLRR